MRNAATHALLRAVHRRLLLQRLAKALRAAAWSTTAALVGVMLVHLFVAPVDVALVLVASLAPWLVAVGWTVSGRITPAASAAWADRYLGGASAYATLLESAGEEASRPASPAVDRLLQWVELAVPRSQEMLRALPLRARLAKPLMAMFVSAALAAILLQIPPQHAAASWLAPADAPAAQAQRAAPLAPASEDSPAAEATDPTAVAQHKVGQAHARDSAAEPELTPANGDDDGAQAVAAATAPAGGAADSRAASGGREAGDSPDTLDDTGLSASWQGDLARRMQTATATAPDVPVRADPSRLVDYAAMAGQREPALAHASLEPAPAVAPEARPRTHAGPAEQAYIRAYFSGSGASE